MEITVLALDALANFQAKYGVEPSGLLMSEYTFELMRVQNMESYVLPPSVDFVTFCGIPIYRSFQMKDNEIRFVI